MFKQVAERSTMFQNDFYEDFYDVLRRNSLFIWGVPLREPEVIS